MQVPEIIERNSTIKSAQMWHFYVLLSGWSSINTVMNVSIVLFLNEALDSIFLAGLALSLGSVFSMLFDGLFSALQKVLSPRTLFLSSIVGILIAVLLFILSLNPFFVFLAAIFFRVSFDLYDITAMSYVLGKSDPKQYGQNLSYKQLSQGIGMIIGLVLSAVLLGAAYFIGGTANAVADKVTDAQLEQFFSSLFLLKVFLVILLGLLFLVAYALFDREEGDINKTTLYAAADEVKKEMLQKYSSVKQAIRHPFSKKKKENRKSHPEKKMTAKEVFSELTGSFRDMTLVLLKKPKEIALLWSMGVMGIFSYWDTFLATFLPIFFTEVLRAQSGWLQDLPGSLLLLLFILPVLGFLPIVAKMGDKYGRSYFMMAGLLLTIIATFIAGIVSMKSFGILIFAGFGIAFGYLFGMSSAKAQAASELNHFLSKAKNKTKIDPNASAGPIMLVDNVGNIIGPALGGLMIQLMGFQGFFVFFSILLSLLLAWTIWRRKAIL